MKVLELKETLFLVENTDGYETGKVAYFDNKISAEEFIGQLPSNKRNYYNIRQVEVNHSYTVYESLEDYNDNEEYRKVAPILAKLSADELKVLTNYFS